MPEITQVNRINVSVEKFLEACTLTELQEIDLLLDKHIRAKQDMEAEFNTHEQLPEPSHIKFEP